MTGGQLRENNRKLTLALYALMLAVGTFYLFYSGPDYSASRSIKQWWNLGHIGYFFILVFLLYRFPPLARLSLPMQWLVLLLFSLLLGTAIELLQYGTSRDPDLGDISRDMAGTLLGLAWHPGLKAVAARVRMWIRVLAVWVLVLHLLPLAIALTDEYLARQQFPLLSGFETPFELDRWVGRSQRQVVKLVDGRPAMQIDLPAGRYPGAKLEYFPADWRGLQSLNLELFNPQSSPLRITLRVHDWLHEQGPTRYATRDRFNRSYRLKPGWNKISVSLAQIEHAPRGRLMDLSNIRDITFFVGRLRQPKRLLLQRIYLL